MAVLAPETLLSFPLGYEGINLLLDQGDTALFLAGSDDRRLFAFDPGAPDDQPLFAGNRDQDGDRPIGTRHGNRQVTAKVRLYGDTDEDLQDLVAAVDAKVDKLRREGGRLVVTVPSGEAYLLDVFAGGAKAEWGKRWVNHPRIEADFEFTCGPYWLEAEEEVTLTTSMTSPCVIATAGPVRGSVPALGRLVINNPGTADQAFVMWGEQSRTYDAAATAALFYEAEDLTPLGDAAVQTITGASGGDLVGCGNIFVADTWIGILSTDTLTHTGDYRVWARIAGSIPDVCTGAIALEWSVGDFRAFTRNTPVSLPGDELNGIFRLVDLGLVSIPDDEGQWEGRVVVKCDPAPGEFDVISVDCLFIMPVDDGYGEATGLLQTPAATVFAAQDDFSHAAGPLTGDTLPAGGDWAAVGDSTDYQTDGSGLAGRTAASDTAARILYADATDLEGVVVGATVDVATPGTDGVVYSGIVARFTDADNLLILVRGVVANQDFIQLVAIVGGTATVLDYTDAPGGIGAELRMVMTANGYGQVSATVTAVSTGQAVTLTGYSEELASGGTLESGAVGLYDWQAHADAINPITRTYDDFYAYEIASDPAIFAGQNLEIRHDRVVREHSTGTALTRVSRYAGDYLLIPQEGSEDRELRLIVKTSRGKPSEQMADSAVEAVGVSLFVTPRWLTLPGSHP